MIHVTKYSFFLIAAGLLFLGTCKKKEIYPSVPSIAYEQAYFMRASDGTDSVMTLVFSFRDGDGDIGLDQADTLPPFQADRDKYNKARNPFYNNLHVEYFEWIDTSFQQIVRELDPDALPPVYDTLRYLYRIENITPEGRHKAIRGDFEINIYPSPHPDAKDTVMYRFYLYDRALNKSNVAETPPLVWKRN